MNKSYFGSKLMVGSGSSECTLPHKYVHDHNFSIHEPMNMLVNPQVFWYTAGYKRRAVGSIVIILTERQ